MNSKLSTIVYKWLRRSGIKVSLNYLDQQLQSHPDFPSLASITDTLDELNIDNLSLVVDREKLDQLPVPFLAHNPADRVGFVVVNNSSQIKNDKVFEKNWDGIVVLAEKPVNWYYAANEKALGNEKKIRKQIILATVVIVFLAAFSLFSQFSVSLAGLLLASIMGLGVAILIVQQELGISNEITEQLCNVGKETDCNAVIHSKGGKIGKWLNWADAGIIYFSSFLFLLVAYPGNPLLSLLSVVGIPFVFFSVYYQWWRVRKWCTLCLLTVSMLTVQFILLLPVALRLLNGGVEILDVDSLSFSSFIFASIAAIWLLVIKPTLQRRKELTDNNYSLQRFKNDPDIFSALLQSQRTVDTTPFENDLQLGNPGAAN